MPVTLTDPYVEIDLSERTVRLYDHADIVRHADGGLEVVDRHRRLLRDSPCSIGMKGFRTPVGHWEMGGRSLSPDWKAPAWAAVYGMVPGRVYKFGQPGNPYSGGLILLNGVGERTEGKTGYAIHGSTNQESIRSRLAASHGCIRVPDWFIRYLYERCPEGTPVRTKR